MEQPWQPVEIRLVPSLPIPHNLYVCLAKIKPRAAAFLKAAYQEGKPLPKNLSALHNGHLVAEYNLGETGACWEGGPSTDFKDILYVFSTVSMEEARSLVQEPVLPGGHYLPGHVVRLVDPCTAVEAGLAGAGRPGAAHEGRRHPAHLSRRRHAAHHRKEGGRRSAVQANRLFLEG